MERLLKILKLILIISPLLACNRYGQTPGGNSFIVIDSGKFSRMRDAIPTGRTPCFGVNVTGPSQITPNPGKCSPTTGIIGGYVQSGQPIQVSVPSNTTVNIDLYLYLLPAGSTAACPVMLPHFPAGQLANTYLIGSAPNVAIAGASVTVDMNVDFPSSGQNIAQQQNMPATCLAGASSTMPYTTYSVSSGGTVNATGGSYKLKASVGTVTPNATLSGSGINITVR